MNAQRKPLTMGMGRGRQNQASTKTHLLFKKTKHYTLKRKRTHHLKNVIRQRASPHQVKKWKGNQRPGHFGPLSYRDPFFYYFPRGWNQLYPGQFGFFPYRSNFFLLGGAAMMYVGFVVQDPPPYSTPTPLRVAGPVLVALGFAFLMLGTCWWCCTLGLFKESLRHTQAHEKVPAQVVWTTNAQDGQLPSTSHHSVNTPPPPPYAIAETELDDGGPGCSYDSLYDGSIYNTLQGRSVRLETLMVRKSLEDREFIV